jgi:hypothetical protein
MLHLFSFINYNVDLIKFMKVSVTLIVVLQVNVK